MSLRIAAHKKSLATVIFGGLVTLLTLGTVRFVEHDIEIIAIGDEEDED